MMSRHPFALAVAAGALQVTPAFAQGGPTPCALPFSGPDVVVGAIDAATTWGTTGSVSAYSLGITTCNVGDAPLDWFASTNRHPVMAQNLYRIEDGRFEQVGMGWLKHEVFALQSSACCACVPESGGQWLGAGCSNTSGAALSGSQSGLGPRFQVNAFTGDFTFPFSGAGVTGDTAFKRVQVPTDAVDPALHPAAVYVAEAQQVSPDDAAAGNGANNVSWAPLARPGSVANGAYRLTVAGATVREQPAIHAWAAADPGVTVANVDVPGEGRFVAGCNVIAGSNGTWRYEYAIVNVNSDLSGGSLSVPIGAGATVTGAGMSFPHYHSGEPYTNVPWTVSVGGGAVTWSTAEAFGQNPDANALRWGTTYTFWFTADAPPEDVTASLGLFKPGGPGAQGVPVRGPSSPLGGAAVVSAFCTATPNSSGAPGVISARSIDLAARTMDLEASSLPANQFGMFLTSLTTGLTPALGGGQGTLCLGGQIGRQVGGVILGSGTSGAFSATVSLDAMPEPSQLVSVMPGETRYFQAWHRDVVGGPRPNLTNGVQVVFP